MIPFRPQAQSEILRSKIIFSFVVEDIAPNFPIDDMPHGHHPWTLKGKILKINKGALEKSEGSSFETTVSIYFGPVRSHPGGLWVNEQPTKGQSWAAFCGPETKSSLPEELLKDKGWGCTVYKLAEVETDLRLAQEIAADKPALDQALKIARQDFPKLGYLYYSFLIETYQDAVLKDFRAFESVLELMEDPALSRTNLYTMMSQLETMLTMRDGDPALNRHANRMIVSYFRLLARSDASDSENLLGTTLPNSVGLEGGMTKRSAAEVFKDYPQDRAAAKKLLEASPHKKRAKVLLQWLAR